MPTQNDAVSWYHPAAAERLSREEGQMVMDEQLTPRDGYDYRIRLGRDAQGLQESTGAISAHDPRLDLTYGEFPLASMDQLIDVGLTYLCDVSSSPIGHITMIDIGSGCGRLVLYATLTRGNQDQSWSIHGIEIAPLLHDEALAAVSRGRHGGFLSEKSQRGTSNSLTLHNGPADEYPLLLGMADLIFAYSTAFPAETFHPEIGAMILGSDWSRLLSQSCRSGCIAITTDRALDPAYGWKLLDRMEVDNREVLGSTGYVHRLEK